MRVDRYADPTAQHRRRGIGISHREPAVADAGGVRLTWPATGEDVGYYQCLRRTAPAGQWQPVDRTTADQRTCLDRRAGAGTYVYGVQAVSASGLASPITESRPVTIS